MSILTNPVTEHDIVAVTIDMTEAEAKQITRKIDLRLVTVAENWEAANAYILEAISRNAHLALGYPSPGAYIADKFGSTLARLSVETRREVSIGLAEAGLSSRAIASVVEVSDRQVRKDIATGGNRVPTSTIGNDNKTYHRPERPAVREPRRRPLPDAFKDAVHDLDRVLRRLESLQRDDRFRLNRPQLREHYWRQISDFESRMAEIDVFLERDKAPGEEGDG